VLTAFIVAAQPAHADSTGATSPGCSQVNSASFSPDCLPPGLLTFSGLYTATQNQINSLQDLETQAVTDTIQDHGLASTDTNAVLSWARPDAEAELFALIVQAINTPAASQTTDQQNVVAWVQTVETRQAIAAAQDAGLEYVKWAGLDQITYQEDLYNGASESTLQSFLSEPPEPYGPGDMGGYCTYQAPAPDQSDYTVNNYAACGGGGGVGGLLTPPPTPSYDQFTEWGEADANYSLQSSNQAVQQGAEIAAGLDFGAVALGAGVAGLALSSGLASGLVGSALWTAIYPYATTVLDSLVEEVGQATADAIAEASTATEIASGAGGIAGAVLFAVTTAVIEGINVANADALPGQLATLIAGAATNTPTPATLLNEANGTSSLFSLFVGATLPKPVDQTCDNTSPIPPGLTVISGTITAAPSDCLNPTAIPPATSTDPQFVVQQNGAVASSTTSSITWEDPAAANSTLTARLSGNWFVVQADGSAAAAQTLSIPYTDWNGNKQVVWLVDSPKTGYQFVGYNATAGASTALDPSTCVTDGTCWTSTSIDYVGGDGNDYSASVQAPGTGNGAPTIGTVSGDEPTGYPVYGYAVEGIPVEFYANTFGPLAAFDPNMPGKLIDDMTYTWQFTPPPCNLGCISLNQVGVPGGPNGPAYGPPITGGTIDYTFPTSGTYSVQLTATDDVNKEQAVDDFTVTVLDTPPTLGLNPGTSSVPVGTGTSLAGTVAHAGTGDIDNVYLDWGDGTVDSGACGIAPLAAPDGCYPGWSAVPGQLTKTSAGALTLSPDIAFSDTHTYASAGTYFATVTVTDQSGAAVRQTVMETITNPAPTLNGIAPTSAPVGSSPTVTVTGSGFVPGSTVEWNGSPLTTTYVSPTELTAQVPATDTTGATAAMVTVVNAGPGGGTTSPEVVYIVPAQTAVAAANVATSTSASDTATASVGGSGAGTAGSLSTAASGAGTVAVAQYSADPETTSPPTAVNAYFDVFVPSSSNFSSLQVTDCDLAGGSVVYYYDATTSQWTAVSGQTYDAATGCVTFTLGTASTPSLTQLSGTEFGVEDVPPTLTLPGTLSVPYHDPISFSVTAGDTQPSDALTLSASGLPSGLNFTDNGNGTATVTGTVTAVPATYPVTVSAGDGVASTSQAMTIIVVREDTTLTYTGASLIANNRSATLSAVLEEDGTAPPARDGQTVTLTLGSGSSAQSCQGQTGANGTVSCQIATVNQPLGYQPVSATFGGDSYYFASSDTSKHALVFSYLPAGGGFALGDQAVHSATSTRTLTWWGSQWAKSNPLSGGGSPASFKGFAQTVHNGSTTVTDPACGDTWTESTTGGAAPPSSVPAYMAVVVPTKVTQSGSTISGNVAEVVIVKTNPGYQPNPADPGTGTVVATLCGS
jgi:hypothetical protein